MQNNKKKQIKQHMNHGKQMRKQNTNLIYNSKKQMLKYLKIQKHTNKQKKQTT